MNRITWSAERSEFVTVSPYCPERAYLQVQIPREVVTVCRIKFKFKSHDQGFSGDEARHKGSYDSCYSWFEVRVAAPNGHWKSIYTLQYNRHAMIEPYLHHHIWDLESGDDVIKSRLRAMRPGEWIQLVPKARFVAWRNYVYEAMIEVVGEQTLDVSSGSLSSAKTFSRNLYHFCKLRNPMEEIRILEILPGEIEDRLQCSIRSISLADADKIPYEALSYCWGSYANHKLLYLTTGNEAFTSLQYEKRISYNLYNAMRALRPRDGPPRVFWIDAVSIDQENAEEREQQVAIMKQVYARASNVVVWLGEYNTAAEQCLRDAERIASRYLALRAGELKGNDYYDHHQHLHESESAQPPSWLDAEIPLFEFEWFHRAWVVQEVFNAKSVQVRCGELVIPWSLLLRMNRCMNLSGGVGPMARKKTLMPPLLSGLFDSGKYISDPLGEEYRNLASPATTTSLEILIRGLDLEATDHRDNVFALLSFGTDVSSNLMRMDPLIRPNYSKTIAAVFQDYTRWWMLKHWSLRILSAVHLSVGRTWQTIFDFGGDISTISRQRATWSFWHDGRSSWAEATLGLSQKSPWRASLSKLPNMDLLRNPPSDAILTLEGILVATISKIGYFSYFSPNNNNVVFQSIYEKLFEPYNQKGTWTVTSYQQYEAMDDKRRPLIDPDVCKQDHLIAHRDYAQGTRGAIECHPKMFFTTKDGDKGFCPPTARSGDLIVVLYGGNVPYVLRELDGILVEGTNNGPQYFLIGECYLEGYMNGSAVEQEANGHAGRVKRTFHLV